MVVGEKFAISCEGCGVCSPAVGPEGQRAETSLGAWHWRALSSTTRDQCWPWPQPHSGGPPDHRQRGEDAVGWLSVQAGPGAACAGAPGMGTNWQST